jgi:hypothetical protein
MRRLMGFLFISVVFSVTNLKAQEQGNILLSGSFKYKVSETLPEELSFFGGSFATDGYKNTQIAVLPRVGYFINGTTAVGLGLGYSLNKIEFKDDTEKETITSPRLIIEPFVRQYKALGEKAKVFFDVSVSYQSGTDKDKYTDSDYPEDNFTSEIENTGFGLAVSPGFTYKIADRIAFEISIGRLSYSKFESKPKGAPSDFAIKSSNYGLELDLKHVMLGVECYLSR